MSFPPRIGRAPHQAVLIFKDGFNCVLIQWLSLVLISCLVADARETKPKKTKAKAAPSQAVEPKAPSLEQLSQQIKRSVVVVSQTARGSSGAGVGAGFVISDDGLVATCLHVIGEGRPIRVRFSDGSEAEATEVHAWDRKMDLAILKVNVKKTRPLELGDSDFLPQGTDVVAMGSPQGLDYSVVQGVVSARRVIDHFNFIQIAIPIESGNSGGPLLDRQGRVHGILTMKSLVTPNLGFAIPINSVKKLLETPNPVPMQRWLAMSQLDTSEWSPRLGAQWSQKGGRLVVQGLGDGFGGRSLCFYQREKPEVPFEVAVTMKMQDEAGAAGLIFGADEGDQHFGFYPTSGQVRLTRFEGPNVYSWTIIKQLNTPHYRPGDWNRLRIRVEKNKVLGYINEHLVMESDESFLQGKSVGLAKFRDTVAEFKEFAVGSDLSRKATGLTNAALVKKLGEISPQKIFDPAYVGEISSSGDVTPDLLARAEQLEQQAGQLRILARTVHRKKVTAELLQTLSAPEKDVDLAQAALLVAWLDNEELDWKAYQKVLSKMGTELRGRTSAKKAAHEKLKTLIEFLFQENGFHGSRTDYYNKSNSYLNEVIDDREGLPVTLSVLMMELGRQVGLDLQGIPVPGHFMVGLAGRNGGMDYFDPFEGGEEKTRAQIEALVLESQGVRLTDVHLKPSTKKEIVTRMIRNLLGLAIENQSAEQTLGYLDVLLAINPEDAFDRWTRGTLRSQVGDRDGARADLQWLMDKQPAGLDLQRVESLFRQL